MAENTVEKSATLKRPGRNGTSHKFTETRKAAYLELLRKGGRRVKSAKAVGVGYDTVSREMGLDPAFVEAIDQAEMDANQIVEDALFQAAKKGNVVACQVWLYNRMPDRWADKRNLNMKAEFAGKVEHSGLDDIGLRELVVALNGLEGKDGSG